MRLALLVLLVLAAVPLATATLPSTIFAGVDPLAGSFQYVSPYSPENSYSCTGVATLQVQKNTEGGWDILVRRGAVVAGPPVLWNDPASMPTAATSCPFETAGSEAHLNVPGSPSQGFSWGYAGPCQGQQYTVYPFTWGGSATYYASMWYNALSCGFGPADYYYGSYVSPPAMT